MNTIERAWQNIRHGAQSTAEYTDDADDVCMCLLDLDGRIGRHISEAAITINDLRERHDTWVRKSALMLEAGKNERTELRERVDGQTRAITELTNLASGAAVANGKSCDEIIELRGRVEALGRRMYTLDERAAIMEKRQQSHEDWHIKEIVTLPPKPEQPHKRHNSVAGMCEDIGIDYEHRIDGVATEEQEHPRGNTPTAEQFEHPESIVMGQGPSDSAKTCETCGHYRYTEDGMWPNDTWCNEIGMRPDPNHQNCKWTPKAEQSKSEWYHLSCDECGHLWWSEEAFPVDCPECGATRLSRDELPKAEDREGQIQFLVDEYYKKWFPFGTGTWATLTEVYKDELLRDPRFPHILDDGKTTGATCMVGDIVELWDRGSYKRWGAYVETKDGIHKATHGMAYATGEHLRWCARGEEPA